MHLCLLRIKGGPQIDPKHPWVYGHRFEGLPSASGPLSCDMPKQSGAQVSRGSWEVGGFTGCMGVWEADGGAGQLRGEQRRTRVMAALGPVGCSHSFTYS